LEFRDSSSFAYIYRALFFLFSFFPFIIIITHTQRDQQAKEVDQLLADDSFHGSIAKRISNKLSTKKSAQVSETEFVKTTGYALA
jgi:hypothetical protein